MQSVNPTSDAASKSRPIPVVIVAYQNPTQLQQCLAALEKQDTPVAAWVHDNSVDNIYYTRAANLGLKKAIGDGHEFAIQVGQDCYLKPGAVSRMVEFMRSHPRCAHAGIKQLLASNPDRVIHAGGKFTYPRGSHQQGLVSAGFGSASQQAPWVNGSCMITRLEAAVEFGLMDENFKLLCCDADWCYTARARGWEVWYCAEAECLHESGVSHKPTSGEMIEIFKRDTDYFREKWIAGLFGRLEKQFPFHINAAGGAQGRDMWTYTVPVDH
jgi:GT2 family glycosyltransferase